MVVLIDNDNEPIITGGSWHEQQRGADGQQSG